MQLCLLTKQRDRFLSQFASNRRFEATLKIVGLSALIFISFLAGAFLSAVLHLGAPIATVNLHNASNKEIASVRLIHEHGLVEIANLPINANRTVLFYAPGESSYKIAVMFSDGQSIESNEVYVEAGYSITETITEQGLESDYRLFAY